jgi:hypothetical protein
MSLLLYGTFFIKKKVSKRKNQIDYYLIIVYEAARDEDKENFLQSLAEICDNLDCQPLLVVTLVS